MKSLALASSVRAVKLAITNPVMISAALHVTMGPQLVVHFKISGWQNSSHC